MPAVVEAHSAQLPSGVRRKLTREDRDALQAAGRLDSERYELIDGELIRKMPKSRLHTLTLLRLVAWLQDVFGRWYVEHETSIDLSTALDPVNEPEPDAFVLRRPSSEFRQLNPEPADILLIVEIAVTSQDYDLGAKASLYANAGIAEYWVLDLKENRIIIHRRPDGERYPARRQS